MNKMAKMKQINLQEIIKKTVSINEYIEGIAHPFKDKFLERKQTYQLNEEIISKLKEYANKVVIVAFSAEWCKDCTANIPVLALIAEKTGIKIRVFGGLKKDPLNPKEKWRIPPSPPEVKTFNVEKIPHIMILNRKGEIIGKITENPRYKETLEEEILYLIEKPKEFISQSS